MRARALVVGVCLLAWAVPADAQKLVFVVRHAERADGGAGAPAMGTPATGAPADPLLSAAGEVRAAKLATMLAEAGVTTIFTTEFKRTIDTAKPLAATLKITPEVVSSRDTAGLLAKIKARPDAVVLVVGHSNTIPAIIKLLGGPDVMLPDTAYGDLFVFVPATGVLTRLRF